MRLLTTATLLCGLMASGAHAQVPAVGSNTTGNPAQANPQKPFRMPASEQQNNAAHPSWTAPQKPFRIYGNTWYVGPRGLGVFLVTAPTGDVLIDGGVPGDAPLIEANIRRLGIRLHDIRWILNSHAHCDHAGGIARLAHDTGAQVIANAADASLLERGGLDDPEFGDRFPFPPVHATRTVRDGESVHLGNLLLTAHATPGHTKGNTSWTWVSCEGTRCLHVADVGSLSAPGYTLIGNPKYPNAVEDFEHSFVAVASLPCDIPIAPHPEMVDFWERVAKRAHGDANALIDPTGCRAYAQDARKSFEAQLAKQRADASARHAALQGNLDALAKRAQPGTLRIVVLDPRNGERWRVNADRAFPMMSMFKAPVAAAVFAQIDSRKLSMEQTVTLTRADIVDGSVVPSIGAHFHGERATFTVRRLLAAAVSESDNTAVDALLKLVPPHEVTAFLRTHGITGMRVDMGEADIERVFEQLAPGQQPPANETDQEEDQRLQRGYRAYLADPRDRSRPDAAADFLQKLQSGALLSPASTHALLALMQAQTKPERLRRGLPQGVQLADKCGTSYTLDGLTAAYNDIGILTWPDGHRVIVAAFLMASPASKSERDALFADLARTVADALHP